MNLPAPLFAATPQYGSVRFVAILLIAAIAVTSACAAPSALRPSDGTWQLTGTINTLTGERIAGARLTVLNGPNENVQVTADSEGRFVFADLASGTFDVLIEAAGFRSITPRVGLFRDIDVNFALSAS